MSNDFDTSGEFHSLMCRTELSTNSGNDLIFSYGDVLFSQSVLMLLESINDEITIVVDPDIRQKTFTEKEKDYVRATLPYQRKDFFEKIYLEEINTQIENSAESEWIGVLKIPANKRPDFNKHVNKFKKQAASATASLNMLINFMQTNGEAIRVLYNTGNWVDIDIIEDLIIAEELI